MPIEQKTKCPHCGARDIQISELKQKLLDKSDAICLEADERDQWQRAAFEQQNLLAAKTAECEKLSEQVTTWITSDKRFKELQDLRSKCERLEKERDKAQTAREGNLETAKAHYRNTLNEQSKNEALRTQVAQLGKELGAAQDMLEQVVARNEKLENENASLRAALEHAAKVFQRYGEQHAAQMTVAASSKALDNYAEAQTCRNAIALATTELSRTKP